MIAAARRADAAAVSGLLVAGADANATDPESSLTALMFAAGNGACECVRALVAHGALVNCVDALAGAAALHKACQGGHLEVVRMLVDAGAFVNLQTTTTGHTPLIEAIWFKSDEIVRYLLDNGARVELKTYYGFTIDDHINYALKVNVGERRQALLRIQAMVGDHRSLSQEQQDAQALNAAVLKGDLDQVRAALADGADVEQTWPCVGTLYDGYTPLLIASLYGNEAIVAELIAHKADVNAVEPVFGAVPLHKGTYNGNDGVVRQLVAVPGIKLDYQGPSNGYTPLHDALWHGFDKCAWPLLNAGARTDIVAYDGTLPVDLAAAELGPDHPLTVALRERSTHQVAR